MRHRPRGAPVPLPPSWKNLSPNWKIIWNKYLLRYECYQHKVLFDNKDYAKDFPTEVGYFDLGNGKVGPKCEDAWRSPLSYYFLIHRDNDLPAVINYDMAGNITSRRYFRNAVEYFPDSIDLNISNIEDIT